VDRIYYQVVTVPAGTSPGAPVNVQVPLEDNQLKSITCIVPDGHCGLTGIQLQQSQQVIFPWSNTQYVVANNEKIVFDYDDQIQSSGIKAVAYNDDIFDHSFYLRFTITNLPVPGAEPEAEVVTPGQTPAAYLPEDDDLDVDNILSSDTGDDTGEIPVVTTPVIVTPTSPVTVTAGPGAPPKAPKRRVLAGKTKR
jgi:hypothetical protein